MVAGNYDVNQIFSNISMLITGREDRGRNVLVIFQSRNFEIMFGRPKRYYRVLTMVYNTQRYWVFGLVHRPDSK
jgi:hypothetical protein